MFPNHIGKAYINTHFKKMPRNVLPTMDTFDLDQRVGFRRVLMFWTFISLIFSMRLCYVL